jgi:hypothetical protein
MDGKGHPLPASDEARHGEIPESLAEEKGLGDDSAEQVQAVGEAVNPDGEAYRYDDNGRAEDVAADAVGNVDVESGQGGARPSPGPGAPV